MKMIILELFPKTLLTLQLLDPLEGEVKSQLISYSLLNNHQVTMTLIQLALNLN